MILLEHGMKMVEMTLEIRFRRIVTVNEMQLVFMPVKGIFDVLIIVNLHSNFY